MRRITSSQARTGRSNIGIRLFSLVFATLLAGSLTFTGAHAQGQAPSDPSAAPAPAEQRATDLPAPAANPPANEFTQTSQPNAPASAVPGNSRPASLQVPHDLSPWGMFIAADMVVKAVMLGLAFASLVTWTIWLAKGWTCWEPARRPQGCSRLLEPGERPAQAERAGRRPSRAGPSRLLVAGGLCGSASARQNLSADGIKERVAIRTARIEARAGRQMTRGTGVLATIGSTAPFVGLFGTVWGIMNSFIGISQAQTTNLAVVAPGIAEALLATAIGLVAAIPAVVIYNVFARAIAGYRACSPTLSGDHAASLARSRPAAARCGLQWWPSRPRRLRAPARRSRSDGRQSQGSA